MGWTLFGANKAAKEEKDKKKKKKIEDIGKAIKNRAKATRDALNYE
ncbi:MAG: hypothetical protein M0R74_09900 [Dehalococcoidia bacterium]|jgi:hypothetical protein|nr:hypothetical protein [Dehalococcoidia bacterium]